MKFSYQDTCGIKPAEIAKTVKSLSPYLDELQAAAQDTAYSTPVSCLALPQDDDLISQIKELVQKHKSPHLHEVMVVGIGGSSLGAQAVYRALRKSPPARGGDRGGGSGVNLSFYDTVDNHHVIQAIETIKRVAAEGRKIILNIISKSGATHETIAIARILLKTLQEASSDWQKQVVVTSEPESKLSNWAKAQGIDTLPNPPQVGGRFSVLSAVGLFPLALAGADIVDLHQGAQEADFNLAAEGAAVLYANMQKRKSPLLSKEGVGPPDSLREAWRAGGGSGACVIHNLFLFDPDLEDLGKWYRQLLAESVGKEGKGTTPMVSIGSTDLHSMVQLYLSGPNDKFTTFVTVNRGEGVKVPATDKALDAIVPNLTNKTLTDVMTAIVEGTKEAYKKRGLPYASIGLEAANERELGHFLQFNMIQTILLAQLMGVNAFDQPNVEEYKVITKKLLAG